MPSFFYFSFSSASVDSATATLEGVGSSSLGGPSTKEAFFSSAATGGAVGAAAAFY